MIAERDAAVAEGLADDGDHDKDGSSLASLERVEEYQGTDMIIIALDVDPREALARLRARAFVRGVVVERRMSLDWPDWRDPDGRVEVAQ